MWVKAGLRRAVVPSTERETVEMMLKDALSAVQGEAEMSKRVEDSAGRVQITENTIAALASSQDAATKVVLGAI